MSEGGKSLVWSSLEILSLSLFTPSNSIFDSQKKPNDSQDKFYFLSCGCRGFVLVIPAWYSYWWCFIVQVKHISEIVSVFKSQNVKFLAQIKTFTDGNNFFSNLSCCRKILDPSQFTKQKASEFPVLACILQRGCAVFIRERIEAKTSLITLNV